MMALAAPPRWPVALGTTCVWALAAASVVFWGLRLAAPPDAPAPPAVARAPVAAEPAEVAKVLGGSAASPTGTLSPEAGSRFMLLGVVADDDGQGAALIAVDGKPARPFRVGQVIGDGYMLQSLDKRAAALGTKLDAPTALTLQLPRPANAASGVSSAAPPRPAANFAPVVAPTVPAMTPAAPMGGDATMAPAQAPTPGSENLPAPAIGGRPAPG